MSVAVAARFRSDRPPGNPFATRFTRPGAVPPLDARGRPLDVAALIAQLPCRGPAAIVAPHGHGKTTLLVAIAAAVAAAGRPVQLVRVRRWADAVAALAAVVAAPAGGLVCIDGWESLGPGCWPLRQAARRLGRRLLVTSHGPAGMPVLWRCDTSPELLRAIIARLPDHGGRIVAEEIDAAFRRHAGDLRATLYDLYDRYERNAAVDDEPCGC